MAANVFCSQVPVAPLLFCFGFSGSPSSPRVRIFGCRIELWIHGKGGPFLLLPSEAVDLIQFAGLCWFCLVPSLFCSCVSRSGSAGQAAPGSWCLCARDPSSRQRLWWRAERASPGVQQQQETPASQRAAEDSAWRHSSTAGARRA